MPLPTLQHYCCQHKLLPCLIYIIFVVGSAAPVIIILCLLYWYVGAAAWARSSIWITLPKEVEEADLPSICNIVMLGNGMWCTLLLVDATDNPGVIWINHDRNNLGHTCSSIVESFREIILFLQRVHKTICYAVLF
jgi:hypothetical protein